MAMVETILGPNSSMFVMAATDTPASIMTAIDAYIVSKGWTQYDAAAPGGLTVGRVYRTLQQGSASTYKYVQIAFSTTAMLFKIWESWNATTHVGTNDGTYYSTGSGSGSVFGNQAITIADGAAIVMFVNQRWLATRLRSNLLVYGFLFGSFEIAKDFGEDDTISTNIFIGTHQIIYPNSGGFGFFGSLRGVANGLTTGSSTTPYNNVVTALGMPGSGYPISTLAAGSVQNGALTMTAVEMLSSALGSSIAKLRGRILGIKMVYGNTVWNDMDKASVLVDSNYHQSTTGTAVSHHVLNVGQTQYDRCLIPV